MCAAEVHTSIFRHDAGRKKEVMSPLAAEHRQSYKQRARGPALRCRVHVTLQVSGCFLFLFALSQLLDCEAINEG